MNDRRTLPIFRDLTRDELILLHILQNSNGQLRLDSRNRLYWQGKYLPAYARPGLLRQLTASLEHEPTWYREPATLHWYRGKFGQVRARDIDYWLAKVARRFPRI